MYNVDPSSLLLDEAGLEDFLFSVPEFKGDVLHKFPLLTAKATNIGSIDILVGSGGCSLQQSLKKKQVVSQSGSYSPPHQVWYSMYAHLCWLLPEMMCIQMLEGFLLLRCLFLLQCMGYL